MTETKWYHDTRKRSKRRKKKRGITQDEEEIKKVKTKKRKKKILPPTIHPITMRRAVVRQEALPTHVKVVSALPAGPDGSRDESDEHAGAAEQKHAKQQQPRQLGVLPAPGGLVELTRPRPVRLRVEPVPDVLVEDAAVVAADADEVGSGRRRMRRPRGGGARALVYELRHGGQVRVDQVRVGVGRWRWWGARRRRPVFGDAGQELL